MQKVVCGKVVNINNMGTIEKAFEGMVVSARNTMVNAIQNNLSLDGIEDASKILSVYYTVYNKLPFPLDCIEDEIKYASIAMIMQTITDEFLRFKVDDCGIIIKINETTGIYFSSKCWRLVNTQGIYWDDFVDMSKYNKHTAYKEYEWVIGKILAGQSLRNYYQEFMGELLWACGNNKSILRSELSRLLLIESIPRNILNIRENSILDFNKELEYTIDIYLAGEVDTGESQFEFRVGKDGKADISENNKVQKIYDFEVYKKDVYVKNEAGVVRDKSINRMEIVDAPGFMCIFERLMIDGIENAYNKVFRGMIHGDTLVFSVDGALYKAKYSEYAEPEEIDYKVDIVGIQGPNVYYYKKEKLSSGVIKSTLYK